MNTKKGKACPVVLMSLLSKTPISPTQDNIKHVVEIKFGTDTFEKPQRDAYTEIAGDRTKVKVLDPDECGCNSDDDGKKIYSH